MNRMSRIGRLTPWRAPFDSHRPDFEDRQILYVSLTYLRHSVSSVNLRNRAMACCHMKLRLQYHFAGGVRQQFAAIKMLDPDRIGG